MNEQQLREAMRGIAEADPVPDEGAAWQRIQGGIDADQRAGRRRTILGVSGLAIAGSAAALVLITGTGDDREAVEVIPADTSTTTADTVSPATTTSTSTSSSSTTTTAATSAVGGLGGSLPARPVAVVVEDDGGSIRLDLYDADTGMLVTRDLARSEVGINDVSVVGETVYFTEELGGDTGIVRMVPWDGSAGPTTPFDLEAGTRSGILSPDGSTFAYAHGGGATAELPSISIIDVDSGEQRSLSWAADDEEGDILRNGPIGNLQWSPDGERLLFRSSVHGAEVLVVDADAASLSEATPFELSGYDAHWLSADTIVGLYSCCYPDFDEPPAVVRATEAENTMVEVDGTPTAVAASPDDTIVVVVDGEVVVIDPDGSRRQLALEGTARDVGL